MAVSGLTLDKLTLKEALEGNSSPARRRQCVDHLQARLGVSERRACLVISRHRSTQRRIPHGREDENTLQMQERLALTINETEMN